MSYLLDKFLDRTTDEIIFIFTKAVTRLKKRAEQLKEKIEAHEQEIAAAVVAKEEKVKEALKNERLVKKLEELLNG